MILIGVGSNLVTNSGRKPPENCIWAIAQLAGLQNLSLESYSPWYVSAPIPRSDQPDYINGVARLSGAADPVWLLERLHEIEHEAGRIRSVPNAARTLDLDLIDCNGIIRISPPPVLPHPRAHERAFVLRPIRDVAPEWVHPTLGRGAAALLAALPPQRIAPLEPDARH